MKKVSIVFFGIGGYGDHYLSKLLPRKEELGFEIAGAVDPFPQGCKHLPELISAGVGIYNTPEAFFAEKRADLAIISSPIHFHARQMIAALENGCDVLCEKPLCGDKTDIARVIETRNNAGKFVMIGYQWSHAREILALKDDISNGVYGRPLKLKSLIYMPRNRDYFMRSSRWAGKRLASDGSVLNDSIANNAAAHYLHNLLYLTGGAFGRSAEVKELKPRLYRLNNIETFDTAIVEGKLDCGAEILYIASHSTGMKMPDMFECTFEKGVVKLDPADPMNEIKAYDLKGSVVKNYGNPDVNDMRKAELAIEGVRTGKPYICCGVETATPHVLVIDALSRESVGGFVPDKIRENTENNMLWVDGLYDALLELYNTESYAKLDGLVR